MSDHLTIGEFSRATRLSPKALRIYHELGLVVPVRVDPDSGYRLYCANQVERARLVSLLRAIEMPLAVIARIVELDGREAAQAVSTWWAQIEVSTRERRELVSYIREHLQGQTGARQTMYETTVRGVPARTIASIHRHLRTAETDAFFDDAFARLRALGPGLAGIEGAPYLIFYGEVSEDSDGPIELCRPVDAGVRQLRARAAGEIEVRVEEAHEEAYVRLPSSLAGWPAMLPVIDAIERWSREQRRVPSGPLRQVLIADQRTAAPDAPVIDLTVPLR